jgi:hypothetical protein
MQSSNVSADSVALIPSCNDLANEFLAYQLHFGGPMQAASRFLSSGSKAL